MSRADCGHTYRETDFREPVIQFTKHQSTTKNGPLVKADLRTVSGHFRYGILIGGCSYRIAFSDVLRQHSRGVSMFTALCNSDNSDIRYQFCLCESETSGPVA